MRFRCRESATDSRNGGRDIAALMDCDTVATLPGREHSKGARLEVPIAERLGTTVVYAHDPVSMG